MEYVTLKDLEYYFYQSLQQYSHYKQLAYEKTNQVLRAQFSTDLSYLKQFDLLELLLVYTILLYVFCQVFKLLNRVRKQGFIQPTIKFVFGIARNTCLKRKIQQDIAKMEAEFYNELQHNTNNKTYRLPAGGMKLSTLMQRKEQWLERDSKFYDSGKQTGNRYILNNDYEEQVQEFAKSFIYHNPLHFGAYPAVRQMEAELLQMTGDLYNTGKEVYGVTTSGGTESIICSMLAYREYYLQKKGIKKPNVIIPETAHVAFDKACFYLGIEVIKIPVSPQTFEVDIRLVRKAVNKNTICLVGSSPNYPHGIQDNIPRLAQIALKHGVGLHVDACLGGFIIPFYKKCGIKIYDFDFTVKGVTSISLDHHKYGLAPKGISVVLYSNPELRRCQYYSLSSWTGGIYATHTLLGSKSGAPVAGAWFAMMYNGYNKFKENAQLIFDAVEQCKEELKAIEDVVVVGNPKINTLAFMSKNPKKINIYSVHYALTKKGWELGATQYPATIHITFTLSNYKKIKQLIADINACILDIKQNPQNYKGGKVAMYGSTQQIPDSDVVDDITKRILDVIVKL